MRTISFYSFSQLLTATSYEFVDKLNLIITIILLAFFFLYALAFYMLIFKYEKRRNSSELLEIKKYTIQAYAVHASFNCVRGFFQGFIHATFTINNDYQIVLLITIDLLFIFFVCKFRKHFNNRIHFILTLVYCIVFLIFNLLLVIYVFDPVNNVDFDFVFMIIIFMLSGVCLIRILYAIIESFYDQIKKRCRKNKIK